VAAVRSELDRRIVALAVPSLGALAAEPLYVLADTAIVGNLGTDPLASLAVAGTVLTALTWLFGFLSMGTTTALSHAVGGRDAPRARGVVVHAAMIAVGIGAVVAALVLVGAPAIARVMGAEGPVLGGAVTYLRIAGLGLPLQLLAFVGHAWFRAHEQVRRSFAIVLVANVVNVVLEVLFVYGLDWGLAGSAWGTVIAQVLAAAMLAIWIVPALRRSAAPLVTSWPEVVAIVRPGATIVLRTAGHVSVVILASATAARLGAVPLAAHQLGMQVFSFSALCLDALAVPAQVLTGQAHGAGSPGDGRIAVARTLRLGALCGGAIGVLVIAAHAILARPFTDDAAVVDASRPVFVILGAVIAIGAFAWVLDGALLGAADYAGLRTVTILAAASFWPVPFVVRGLDLGLTALWCGLLWWMCVRTALIAHRWTRVPQASPG
jgi:putative MATE family efflux protein